MKTIKLKNMYTGGHIIKIVKDNFSVRVGQVISFDKHNDKDYYKLYRVVGIKKEA